MIYSVDASVTDFTIDSSSGVISSTRGFDYDTEAIEYMFSVMVEDVGVHSSRFATVDVIVSILDVNDEQPTIGVNQTFGISEDAGVGGLGEYLDISDADTDAMELVVTQTSATDTFAISNTSFELILLRTLDFDTGDSQFTIAFSVFDGVQTSSGSVVVFVTNVNDLGPVVSGVPRFIQLHGEEVSGDVVFVANATDADSDNITFSIVDGSNSFHIDQFGAVTIIRNISESGLEFVVQVSDGGVPELTDTATVVVLVGKSEDFRFSVSNIGYLVGNTQSSVGNEYGQLVGFTYGGLVGGFGTVTGHFGSLSDSSTFTVTRRPAVNVSGVLSSDEVWLSDRRIRVGVRVVDELFNVRVSSATVRIRVVPDATLSSISSGEVTGSCTISGSTTTGSCVISSGLLRYAWFADSSLFSLSQDPSVAVYVYLDGAPSNEHILLGNVAVRREREFDDVVSGLRLSIPANPAFRGDRVTAVLSGHAGFQTQTFFFQVQSAATLEIASVTLVDSSKFTLVTTQTSSNDWSVFGQLQDASTASPNAVAAEDLVNIVFVVKTSAVYDTLASVNIVIKELTNVKNEDLYTSDAAGEIVYQGTRVATGPSVSGGIFVIEDAVRGIFASVDHTDLVNTAVLTGTDVTKPITIRGFTSTASFVTVSNGDALCSLSETGVVSIGSGCSSIDLISSEGGMSDRVTVAVTVGGLSSSVSVRVWAPTLPVDVMLDDPVLNAVSGWFDPNNGCTQKYQQTNFHVKARFATPSKAEVVFVTDLVSSLMVSNDTNVAVLEGSAVVGVGVGNVRVELLRGTQNSLGNAFASVSDEVVEVFGIVASVKTGVTVTLPSSVSPGFPLFASATTEQVFELEGAIGTLYAYADFTDSSTMPISGNSRVDALVESTNPNVVEVEGGVVKAIGSGKGDYVSVSMSSTCTNSLDVSGFASVAVNIPLPDDILVSVTHETITSVGSVADSAGVETSSSLSVSLVFGSTIVDFTNDTRTVYSHNGSSVASLSIQSDGSRLITASPNVHGVFTIQVSFTHINITRSVDVNIIQASVLGVTANPFPVYSGSTSKSVTSLSPIAQTSAYQQARLNAILTLTDDSTRDVSASGLTSFSVATSGSSIAVSGRTASRFGSATSGSDDITVNFAGMAATSDLTVSLSPNPVFVVDILDSSRQTGSLTFQTTLSGSSGSATGDARVGVRFDDGTEYPDVVRNGNVAISGLLTFGLDTTVPASVDATNGRVTLVSNWPEAVVITASSVPNGITGDASFACNLNPEEEDVDLGSTSGLAIASVGVGSEFDVNVRVNTGTTRLGSIDLSVFYDETKLQAVSVSQGSDWPSTSQLLPTIDDPPGEVLFGGGLDGNGIAGVSTIAVIRFKVLNGGASAGDEVALSGSVNTMADLDGNLIGATGRQFVSGSVTFLVSGARRRRRVDTTAAAVNAVADDLWLLKMQTPSMTHVRERRGTCSTPPCTDSECTQLTGKPRETGDADGNCVFDVRDVRFTIDYILYSSTGFSNSEGQAFEAALLGSGVQEDNMDADLNGVIDGRDSSYLARVNFKQLRFIQDVSIASVADASSGCNLTISASLLSKGDVGASSLQTFLYFDIVHASAASQDLFLGTDLLVGSVASHTVVDGVRDSFFGGYWQAEKLSADGAEYGIVAQTGVILDGIGVSLVLVTTDANGVTNVARQFFLDSPSGSSPAYSGLLDVNVGALDANIYRGSGYTPFTTFDNIFRSDICSYANVNLEISLAEDHPLNVPFAVHPALNGDLGLPDHIVASVTGEGVGVVSLSDQGEFTLISSLDREVKDIYSFQAVLNIDGSDYESEITITVLDVNDNAPMFTSEVYDVSVEEESGNVTLVRVNATDIDDGSNAMFSYGTDDARVSVDASTGLVTLLVPLDREAAPFVEIVVFAEDMPDVGDPLRGATLVNISLVDINDNSPTFDATSLSISIFENNMVGDLVGVVGVEDADAALNGKIASMSITTPQSVFAIDEATGTITALEVLDREELDLYLFEVVVSDGGAPPRTSSATVRVSVLDVNDNPPIFRSSSIRVPISERSLGSMYLRQLIVTDADIGENAEVSFSFVDTSSQTESLQFQLEQIDSLSAGLLLSGNKSALPATVFTLTIRAMDSGTPSLMTEVDVELLVTNTPRVEFTTSVYAPQAGQVFTDSIVSQEFGPLYSVGAEVDVDVVASIGNFTLFNTFSTERGTASRLSVIVITPTVYNEFVTFSSDRELRFSVLAQDGDFSATSFGSLSLLASLSADDNANLKLSTSCVVNENEDSPPGLCSMTMVVPESWFFSSSSRLATLTVSAEDGTLRETDTVVLQPSSVDVTSNQLENDVWCVMPARDVFGRQPFSVPVMGYASANVQTFEVVISIGSAIQFVSSTSDNFVLSSRVIKTCLSATNDDGSPCLEQIEVTGTRSGSLNRGTEGVVLLDLSLFARSTTIEVVSSVSVTVNLLVDGEGGIVLPEGVSSNPFVGSGIDRFGPHHRAGGDVFILPADHKAGVFATLSSPSLINYVPLGGPSHASQVVIHALSSNPLLEALVPISDAECSTTTAGVDVTASGCVVSTTSLPASTTTTTETALIMVSLNGGSVTTVATGRLWSPTLPATVKTDVEELNVILNAGVVSSCGGGSSNRYESSVLSVLAEFTSGSDGFTEDVVVLVGNSLVFSSEGVVALGADGKSIVGLQAGATTIALPNVNGGVSGSNSIMVTVSDASPVEVFGFDSIVFIDAEMSLTPSMVSSPMDNVVASLAFTTDDASEGDEVKVAIYAILGDGVVIPLTKEDGLVVSSNDESVLVKASDTSFRVVGTGTGDYVHVVWENPCSGMEVARGDVYVSVTLNENSPVFSHSVYGFSVLEEQPMNSKIGTVVAVDPDVGRSDPVLYAISQVNYTLDGVVHVEEAAAGATLSFRVDLLSGDIFFAEGASLRLDREHVTNILISLASSNLMSDITMITSGTANLTSSSIGISLAHVMLLDINDNAPTLSLSNVYARVFPVEGTVTLLPSLDATDADEGVNAEVSFFSSEQDNVEVVVEEASGMVTTTGDAFSLPSEFEVTVGVIDGGGLSTVDSFSVEVFDFRQYVLIDIASSTDIVLESMDELVSGLVNYLQLSDAGLYASPGDYVFKCEQSCE
eukprot:m.31960 g.31960  ORF g.31960 m.31960 type:complete len:3122 (-) comp9745_c0_seq1:1104-10469(-)